MKSTRRNFLKTGAAGALGSGLVIQGCVRENPGSASENPGSASENYAELDRVLNLPVLRQELFPDPVIIEQLELLRNEDSFICRVRSREGAEGISISIAPSSLRDAFTPL